MSSSLAEAPCPTPIAARDRIVMGHGSGGRLTSQLIEERILPAFRNPALEALDDQAVLDLGRGSRIAFTTDSYVVSPIFFPGGDIGSLAVHGTVNDLAMGGAVPVALSLSLILEEGLPLADLERVIESARAAANAVGVPVVTGDTKVVGHGSGDGIFINTSGIGVVPDGLELGSAHVRPGDQILVSGTLGDHGIAVLAQRQRLELEGELTSDSAPLHGLAQALLVACPGVRMMRDPTRGGLAATLVEVASRRRLGIEVAEAALPVKDAVRGACELLGLEPIHVANEGKLVAFVPEDGVDAALAALRDHPLGRDAAWIGRVTSDRPGTVVLRTPVGGMRILDLPYAELLPRIC
ncbi:hydrogenase expression/formation protein HypE [Vulgatibacter incomptus]|uniref:[NiFe] hydrogenase metallocenter assembly protein HypE n=1 Tax=Vulgatibacter incomptus TaxID=1391653 RepID=A0A0K1P9F1_9BACT|nr:hydrogenase expression/formation protein HypE [Vulgatibacter incomptus]AKU90142.1 [NiFe] hydrogenase metallocenter assembly protein HypE [Vulgatibacter incomptus]